MEDLAWLWEKFAQFLAIRLWLDGRRWILSLKIVARETKSYLNFSTWISKITWEVIVIIVIVVGFPLRWYKGGSKSGALSCIASIIQRSCCLRVSFRWLLSNNLYHERNNAWRVIRSREETSIPSCFRSNRYPAITGSISNRSSGRWRANRRILGSRIKRGYWNKSRVQVGPGDRSTSIHKSFPVAINRSY